MVSRMRCLAAAGVLLAALASQLTGAPESGDASAERSSFGSLSSQLQVLGYAGGNVWRGDSLLNPGNRLAQLPGAFLTQEVRLNLRYSRPGMVISCKPRLFLRQEREPSGAMDSRSDEYLN